MKQGSKEASKEGSKEARKQGSKEGRKEGRKLHVFNESMTINERIVLKTETESK